MSPDAMTNILSHNNMVQQQIPLCTSEENRKRRSMFGKRTLPDVSVYPPSSSLSEPLLDTKHRNTGMHISRNLVPISTGERNNYLHNPCKAIELMASQLHLSSPLHESAGVW